MNTDTPKPAKRKRLYIAAILLAAFAGMQLFRPEIPNPPVTGDFEATAEVKQILKRACYDCHSNETALRWYDKINPVYWQVAEHVKEGREGLNFSTWKDLAPGDQKAKLWEAVNQIAAGAMPIKNYEVVHSSAKISPDDLAVLKKYVSGWVSNKPADTAKTNAAQQQYAKWKKGTSAVQDVPKALNGISYIPDYKNWQVISTTDRQDNGTMRVIFGNDIAVKAVAEGHTNPWPDGTIFAKVAWEKLADKDGNVRTGIFKQVEYMIKDAKKYASTTGWGFARFKTPKMVPYGKDLLFANECVNCHRPMRNNDFVFTVPVKH